MVKKTIQTDKAPKPVGPYSQAVDFGGYIFSSGQVGLTPEGKFAGSDIESQTERVLQNLKGILEDSGSSMDNVIKATVYLTDMNEFSAMNAIYEKYFGKNPPARTTVQVSRLPLDARVEIDVIAFKN